MHTTKNLLTRLTLGAGIGLTVIAGGAIAAGAAPPNHSDEIDAHPPYDFETHPDLVVGEPAVGFTYPLDLSEIFVPDTEPESDEWTMIDPPGDFETEPLSGDELPDWRIPLPDDAITIVPTPEVDPEIGSGPAVDIEDCNPVAVCPTPEIPEDTPEIPEDTPEDIPETDPVVPTSESSLPLTGAGSILLAAVGAGIAGIGVVAHRLSSRFKH